MRLVAFAIANAASAAALQTQETVDARPSVASPSEPRFDWRELSPEQSGVDFVHKSGAPGTAKRFMIECVGTGIALFDADGDGDLDLYCVQGGQVAADGAFTPSVDGDRLYLNDGAAHFHRDADCATGTGFGFGVTAADVDGDDDLDLFVADLGPSRLLINAGGGKFAPAPGANGLAGPPGDWSMCGAFADADGDGDLDVYVTTYLAHDLKHPMIASGRPCRWLGCEVPCGPKGLAAQPDHFYLNDGRGHFTDATKGSGFDSATPGYSFQAIWTDVDDDGRPDLFVANDSMPHDLFRNLGPADGAPVKFEECALRAGCALSDTGKEQAGMGVAVADLDGDLSMDIVITNFSQEQNGVFRNESRSGTPLFTDDSARTGLGWPSFFDLGWGVSFLDADLDGDLDVLVANGHIYPQVDGCGVSQTTYAERCRLYEQVSPGRFRDATDRGGPALQRAAAHRGSAIGDLDGDGRVDVVIATLDGPPRLLLNATPPAGSWIRLLLLPPAPAVGARVVLTDGTRRWAGEVHAGSSFLSSEDPAPLQIGVPADATLSATVRWRDGRTEIFRALRPGATAKLVRGHGEAGP